jgi:general secretion pathway protein G
MKRQKGFTLIELLIVVAIIGIIAAIAIPNLLNAIDRGKQKRSMADIRSIGTAVESYAVDNNFYPKNQSSVPTTLISPIYIRTVPAADGWNTAWEFASDAGGTTYTIESWAKDATDNADANAQTTNFNCDIVFVNGQFYQWPQGTQT